MLAVGAARHRAIINTVLSLLGSTVSTFVLSGLLGHRRLAAEDIQNASLAGGVVSWCILYTLDGENIEEEFVEKDCICDAKGNFLGNKGK